MKTYKLAIMGIAIAMNVILTRFMCILIPLIGFSAARISFGVIIVILISIFFGPLSGGIVGMLSDLIGAVLFPIGVYFPGFTLTAFLSGVVSGYVFLLFNGKEKNISFLTCVMTVLITLLFALGLNLFWATLLYSVPIEILIVPRGIAAVVKIIFFPPIIFLLCKIFKKIIPK